MPEFAKEAKGHLGNRSKDNFHVRNRTYNETDI